MKAAFIIFLSLTLFGTTAVTAVPIPTIGPLNLEGRIAQVTWRPEQKMAGRPGLSGSLGRDRKDPAHFLITLIHYRGVEATTAWAMSRYLQQDLPVSPEHSGAPAFILLKIYQKDSRLLKAGMYIRLRGYLIRGDEGGTWTSYQSLEILDR